MSNPSPARRNPLSKWLKIQYDAFFALRANTVAALKELLDRIVTIIQPAERNRSKKPTPARSHIPQVEPLEVRLVPAAYGIITPIDPLLHDDVKVGEMTVTLQTGNLHVDVGAAKDYSILEQDALYYYPGLEYNSDTASPKPFIAVSIGNSPSLTAVKATLTWNGGSPQSQVTFGTGTYTSGVFDFTLQVNSAVTTSGYYTYSIAIERDYSSGPPSNTTKDGSLNVAVNGANPYGHGWTLADENYLAFNGDDVILVRADGAYSYFTYGSGIFTSPDYDYGTLTTSGGDYTYTDADNLQWNYSSTGQLTTVVDMNGLTVSYSYDGGGLLTSVHDPNDNEVQFGYSSGKLANIRRGYVDGGGFHAFATTTIAYDGSGNFTAVVDPDGNTRSFTYDASHKLLTDTDPTATVTYDHGAVASITLGSSLSTTTIVPQMMHGFGDSTGSPNIVAASDFRAEYTPGSAGETSDHVDDNGRLLDRELPSGATESYTRNFGGLPTSFTDADGNVTTMTYVGGTHRLETVGTPDGLTTTYHYDSSFNTPTEVIDGYGRTTSYAYDTSGNLTLTTYPDGSTARNTYSNGLLATSVDQLGKTTTYDYDANRRLTAVVDSLGHTMTASYDLANGTVTTVSPTGATSVRDYNASGQLTSQVDAGHTTSIQYDANGNVTATVDPLGHTSYQRYDSADRLTATVDANGATMRQLYDDANRITATVDALGKTSYQYYDTSGNVTASVDALGHTTQQKYDAAGHVTASIDALGHTSLQKYDSTGQLTAVVDAAGSTTLYDYDTNRRLTATVDALGHTSLQVYDSSGRVTASVDTNGHTAHQYYDSADRVTAAVDANGKTSFTQYDAAGRTTATVDANGHTSFTKYDSVGQVTATIDANGNTSFSDYDSSGRVTATVDANGHTSFTQYDTAGRVTATVDANGKTSSTNYDAAGRVTSTVDANGHTAYTNYDADGRATSTVDRNGKTSFTQYDADGRVTASVDANGKTSFTDYDAAGQVTAVVDANGKTSFTDYDVAGRVTATVDANGNTSFTNYDAAGRVTSAIDANGKTSFTQYDALGHVTATVDANSVTSFTAYDSAGNVTRTINGNGATTLNYYDAANRLTQFVDNDSRTAQFAYDSGGRLTQSIDVHGYTTKQQYDADGRVTASVDVNGNTAFTQYDSVGQATQQIDGVGNTTKQYYDADGRVTASLDGRGNTTQQKYDADGQVTAVIDGLGKTTLYAYDNEGRRTSVVDPNHNTTTMAFDAVGRLTQTIDANNHTSQQKYDADGHVTEAIAGDNSSIVISYDPAGRETQQIWYDKASAAVNTLAHAYDNDGHLTSASNVNGTYSFSYDNAGRLTQVIEPYAVTLNYAFDGIGRQTQVIDSLGGTQTSTYDLENRLTTRKYSGQSNDMRVDLLYNAQGLVGTQKYYRDLTATNLVASTSYAYDADNRVTSIQGYDHTSATIDHFVSAYDAAGNLSTETDTQNSVTATTSYTYDTDNQLAVGGGVSYDDNGNRTGAGYSVGAGNQMTADATWAYTYDEKGNQTKKSMGTTSTTWKYVYDNRNELTSAKKYSEDPDVPGTAVLQLQADYKYDVFGNRIEKSVDDDGAGPHTATITRFALDGWNPVKASPIGNENSDVLADLDGNNSNALLTKYVRGDVVDQLWARIDSTTPRWYLSDRQSSARDVIDNNGTLKDAIAYDGFGNITSETASAERGRYAWTGRETETETGLQYNRARYYDATTGRWISQDPLGFDAGDGNLYRYASNRPLLDVDPSGLMRAIRNFNYNYKYQLTGGADNQKIQKLAGGLVGIGSNSAYVSQEVPENPFLPDGPLVSVIDPNIGVFLSIRGPKETVQNVRWIQFFAYNIEVIVKTNNAPKRIMLPPIELPEFKTVSGISPSRLTSNEQKLNSYLDSAAPGELYYYQPGSAKTGIGGVTDTESWIEDRPNGAIAQFSLKNYLKALVSAKRLGVDAKDILGFIFHQTFTSVAVTIPNNIFLAAATWEGYCGGSRPSDQGAGDLGTIDGYVLDQKLHYTVPQWFTNIDKASLAILNGAITNANINAAIQLP